MKRHLHLAPEEEERQQPKEDGAVPSAPIRVVLADDHLMMRRSLRLLLDAEAGVQVVAEAGSQHAAVHHVRNHSPDVVVLDLRMGNGSGIESVRSIAEHSPGTATVVLSMEDDPLFAQRAIAAGAIAFVAKDLADEELALAVRAASRGEEYVSPRVAARLDALHRSLTGNRLSQREVEVLRLISLGHTTPEIARKLHLSPRTIETHRANVHRKLGLQTRAELVRYALRRGLIGT